jgi:predicted molibdopterin-dependent oxidoreductase YjgC
VQTIDSYQQTSCRKYTRQAPGYAARIQKGGALREATWDEALGLVADRLNQIKDESGPDAIGFLASAKCTNEENYLLQKLARGVIGTNNVDDCARL